MKLNVRNNFDGIQVIFRAEKNEIPNELCHYYASICGKNKSIEN